VPADADFKATPPPTDFSCAGAGADVVAPAGDPATAGPMMLSASPTLPQSASVMDLLDKPEVWAAFLEHKRDLGHLLRRDERELIAFIDASAWQPVTDAIAADMPFPIPERRLINKLHGSKRTVYSFPDAEQQVLKLLAWLLYRFDDRQPDGCYSFRHGKSAHRALRDLLRVPDLQHRWCYKLDVSDYFNSIPERQLLEDLREVLHDDVPLYRFLTELLTADVCMADGRRVFGSRGVMAGCPLSPFLANIYLAPMDDAFVTRGIPYARYSDDIIMFCDSPEQLSEAVDLVTEILDERGLSVNEDKVIFADPGETWEFLGFAVTGDVVDLSRVTKLKLKGKIRRKARALHRWMVRKNATATRAMRAMIRVFNRKFYQVDDSGHELTWARWFFPMLTTDRSLKEIDHYLQQELRSVASGCHRDGNFKVSYDELKELGFRSLVHEYWRYRHAPAEYQSTKV
jgi:hypothetical protein